MSAGTAPGPDARFASVNKPEVSSAVFTAAASGATSVGRCKAMSWSTACCTGVGRFPEAVARSRLAINTANPSCRAAALCLAAATAIWRLDRTGASVATAAVWASGGTVAVCTGEAAPFGAGAAGAAVNDAMVTAVPGKAGNRNATGLVLTTPSGPQ